MTNFEVIGNVIKHCLDIFSPSKLKQKIKQRNKSIKISANIKRSDIQTHSLSRLPLLKLDELLTSLRSFCHTSLFTFLTPVQLYAEHGKAGFLVGLNQFFG